LEWLGIKDDESTAGAENGFNGIDCPFRVRDRAE
jgi:hypothetical protein